MHRIKMHVIFIFLICISVFCGCVAKDTAPYTTQVFAMDTVIDITAYGDSAKDAVSEATKEIYRLEKLFSVTMEESDIYKLNHASADEVVLSGETYALLQRTKDISALTNSKFDITIYPVLRLWGFTEKDYKIPSSSQLTEALKIVNTDNIILLENNTARLLNNAQVDLGGIAKGYIADKAAKTMKSAGCESGIISLGGNVRTIGTKPSGEKWSIGIKSPDSTDYFATLSTEECSVITSGAYQRNFTKDGVTYHHIIDPKTGKPSDSDAVSVTIIGKDGTLCDALSTAIFIGGSDYAQSLCNATSDFEYIILTKDNKIYLSKSLRDSFSLTENHSHLELIYN